MGCFPFSLLEDDGSAQRLSTPPLAPAFSPGPGRIRTPLLGFASVLLSILAAAGSATAATNAANPDAIFGWPRSSVGAPFSQGVYATTMPLLAPGDFDGDSHLDLAVATGYELKLMLGDGEGTFVPSQAPLPAGSRPAYVLAADLNDDGQLDLLLGNTETSRDVVVLRGYGNGSFEAPIPCNVGRADNCALADLNGDRRLDLLLSQVDSHRLLLLLGRGDGTFSAGTRISSAAWPGLVAIADCTGEGRPDIVFAEGSSISVLPGNGDGTFQTGISSYAGGSVRSFAVGDLNGDGKPDLAMTTDGAKAVSILLGASGGTFRIGETLTLPDWGISVRPVDLDGDGHLDLVVSATAQQTYVLPGRGDGSFAHGAAYEAGAGVSPPVIVDVNHDSKLDMVMACQYTGEISTVFGNGDGSFVRGAWHDVGPDPYAVAAADFNGDGNLDLAVANAHGPLLPANSTIFLLLGNKDGTFRPAGEHLTGPLPSAIVAADLNYDGKLDIVTANRVAETTTGHPAGGTVSILIGQGDGSFQPPVHYGGGAGPVAVVVADFNSDGQPDLAVGAIGQSDFSGGSVSIRLGRGDGTFGDARGFRAGKHLLSLALVDLHNDGKPGLLAGTRGGAVLLKSQGDGTFENEVLLTPLGGITTAADVDLDGRPDLVVATNGVWICFGKAGGSFAPGVLRSLPYSEFSWGVSVLDLNDDGEQDFLQVGAGLWVSRGQGRGDFKPKLAFDAGTRVNAVCYATGDFNHDGKPDLAVLSDRHLTVLLNGAAPPPLELATHFQGGSLTLSWSSRFPGAILESTDTVAPPHWVTAAEAPAQQFGHWEAQTELRQIFRHFRLRLPENQ